MQSGDALSFVVSNPQHLKDFSTWAFCRSDNDSHLEFIHCSLLSIILFEANVNIIWKFIITKVIKINTNTCFLLLGNKDVRPRHPFIIDKTQARNIVSRNLVEMEINELDLRYIARDDSRAIIPKDMMLI